MPLEMNYLFMVLTEMSLINMVFYLKVLLMKLVDCLSIIKITKCFPEYLEQSKGSVGKPNNANFTWEELIELGKEFLGK